MGSWLLFDLLFWPMYLLDQIVGRRNDARAARGLASSNTDILSYLVGRTGLTRTPLRPVGKVRIDGISYPARSAGPFIDAAVPVVVVGVEAGELIVDERKAPGNTHLASE